VVIVLPDVHYRQDVLVGPSQREHAVWLHKYWIRMNYRMPKLDLLEVKEILAVLLVESRNVLSIFLARHPVG